MADVLARAALEYARQGLPVFPVHGKVPFLEGGYKVGTPDPVVVRELWARYPHSNIGYATGTTGWVLDVDPRHGGDLALADLEQHYGPLPETPEVQTGGGGRHLHFAPDVRIGISRGALPAGLDVRGFGGLVVLPPSVHPETKKLYVHLIGRELGALPRAVAPAWLPDIIISRPDPTQQQADPDEPVEPGGRHHFLLRRGYVLAYFGVTEAALVAELDALNKTRCIPPLPEKGVAGWHRLLPTLLRYAARARAQRRADQHARRTFGLDDVEDLSGDVGTATDMTWSDVLPLEAALAPPFPVHVVPPILANVIADIAAVTHTPLDMAGLGVLVTLSTLGSRRVDVAIGPTPSRITHIEPLNLYGMLIADSGERKGPVHRGVLDPLYALQAVRQAAAHPTFLREQEARRLAERRLERLRDQAAREDDDTIRARLNEAALQLAATLPTVQPLPVLVVSDRTVEMLEIELMQQDGALLLTSEEAGSLLAIMGGRFTKDGSLQIDVYLKGYDRGEIDVARISRGRVRCSTPELSLFMTPQRSLLRELRARPEFHDRGLLPRFLFSLPPSPVGDRPISTEPPRKIVRAAYASLLKQLETSRPRLAEGKELPHLLLTGPSWECWAAYALQIEHELREFGKFGSIREWGNKHPGRVARLAGLLHLATFPGAAASREISPVLVEAACTLGAYFEAHTLTVYDLMGALPHLEGARRVLRWLRYTKKSNFTEREATQAFRIGQDNRVFASVDELRPCLRLLVEHGYLHPHAVPPRHGPGRPPSPGYLVHPGWLTSRDHRHHTVNPNFEESEDVIQAKRPPKFDPSVIGNSSSNSSEFAPREASAPSVVESTSSNSSEFLSGDDETGQSRVG